MTTETPPPPPPPPDTKAAPNAIPNPNAAAQDAAHREAVQYWGYLIKDDKCGTAIFDRLLKGIARFIVRTFEAQQASMC
jgi:hypothetical protein